MSPENWATDPASRHYSAGAGAGARVQAGSGVGARAGLGAGPGAREPCVVRPSVRLAHLTASRSPRSAVARITYRTRVRRSCLA